MAEQTLRILRLAGNEAEMGRQHGAIVRSCGGRPDLATFYPQMAGRMLTLRMDHSVRPAVRAVFQPFLAAAADRLHARRLRSFESLVRRSEAGMRESGVDMDVVRWLTVMDVFQNGVSTFARMKMPSITGLQTPGIGMCSSLAVWGEASVDGTLRHARNFDFPGIGVWDSAPTVVFCSPDEGVRYGFVTSLGVDLPGVTGFNEAGITVSAHTRMHVDTDPDGVCIADLGHEIVRRARSIADAIDIAKTLGSSSTWGLLVSSANEQRAVVIETTGRAVAVVDPGTRTFQACTNRYQDAALAKGEVVSSDGFTIDSDARFESLQRTARRGGLSAEDLQELLGATWDPAAPADDPADRRTGSCIVSPITVQSVVVEPALGQVRVAAGRAPTSRSPWRTVPWSWDGAPGLVEAVDIPLASPESPLAAAEAAYVEAARLEVEGGPARQVRNRLHSAAELAPKEPHLQFLGALAALSDADPDLARQRLQRGLEVEFVPYRRAQLLRWSARIEDALGAPAGAAELRATARGLGDGAGPVLRLLERDEKSPPRRGQLYRVLPDVLLVDA